MPAAALAAARLLCGIACGALAFAAPGTAAADQIFMITELGNLFHVPYQPVRAVQHGGAEVITSGKDGAWDVGPLGLYAEHPANFEMFTAVYGEGRPYPIQLYKRYEYRDGALHGANPSDALFPDMQVRSFGGHQKWAGSITAAGPGITILRPAAPGVAELAVYGGVVRVVDTPHEIMSLPYHEDRGFQVASEPVPLRAEIEGPSARCGVFGLEIEIPVHLGGSPELELPERTIRGMGPKFWSGSGHEGGCSIYSSDSADIEYLLDGTVRVATGLGPALLAKNVDPSKDVGEQFSIRGDIWYKNLIQDYTTSVHNGGAKIVMGNMTYLVLEPEGGRFVEVAGRALEISGLPPLTPYKLYGGDTVISAGHADQAGNISVPRVDQNLDAAVLVLYEGISADTTAVLDRTRMEALYTDTAKTYDVRAFAPLESAIIIPDTKGGLVRAGAQLHLTGGAPVIPGTKIQTGGVTLEHGRIIKEPARSAFGDVKTRVQYPHAAPLSAAGAPAHVQVISDADVTTIPFVAGWSGHALVENVHAVGRAGCAPPVPPAGNMRAVVEAYRNGIPYSSVTIDPEGHEAAHAYAYASGNRVTEGVRYEYGLSFSHSVRVQGKDGDLVEVQITPILEALPSTAWVPAPDCVPWYTDGMVVISAAASGSWN